MDSQISQNTTAVISREATRSGLPKLGTYFSDVYRYRTFAYYWSKADIKARNFETVLGRLWHYLNPLLFGLIYFIFVGIVSGQGLNSAGRLALIVGNIYVFTFFSSTIQLGVSSVNDGAGGVLTMSAIPRVVLPMASTITAGNLFMRSMIAYIPIHILGNRGLHIEMLWIPVLIVATGLFGFGIALLMGVANVYFRDVSRLLPHALRLWLYFSPAIWSYTQALGPSTLETLARVNPLFAGMTAWTIALGGPLATEGPSVAVSMAGEVGVFCIWAVAATVIGFLVFVSREDDFVVRN